MLQPKKQKYRKQFRGHMNGSASRGQRFEFRRIRHESYKPGGGYQQSKLKLPEKPLLIIPKGVKYGFGFPDKPITKKALGTRMGSGKGDIVDYVAVITPGRIILKSPE